MRCLKVEQGQCQKCLGKMPRKEAEVEQYQNPARRKTLVRLKANITYRYVLLLTPTKCC